MMGALWWRKEIQSELFPLEKNKLPQLESFQSYLNYYSLESYLPQLNVGYIENELNEDKWMAWHICVDKDAPYALVIHGLFDHTAYMAPLFSTLLDNGLNILAIDLPGHGLSSGDLLETRDFNEYGEQNLAAKEWLKRHDKKLFVEIAHSTGAVGIFQMALRNQQAPHTILLNPLVKITHLKWLKNFIRPASKFIQTVPRSKRCSNPNLDFVNFRLKDPLQPWYVTLKWLSDYLKWVDHFEKEKPITSHNDLVVIQGAKDSTVDPERSNELIQHLFPLSRRRVFESMGHQLLNTGPDDKKTVLEAIDGELNRWRSSWPEGKS